MAIFSGKTKVDPGKNGGFLSIRKAKKIQVRFLAFVAGFGQGMILKILRVIITCFLKNHVSFDLSCLDTSSMYQYLNL